MMHKLIMWISAIASIAGLLIVLIEKYFNSVIIDLPPNVVYSLIILGISISIVLAKTDKSPNEEKFNGSVTENKITGNPTIITNPNYVNSINIGDSSTSAQKRYESGYFLIKEEIISNYSVLSILIKSLQDNKPEKFWDIRKPNESEDTYQERAKSFYLEYQTFIFQMIKKFPISQEVYNTHKLNLSHNPEIADSIQKSYYWLTETYGNLIAYSDSLQHNISLGYRNVEMYYRNDLLCREKYVNARILLLQSIEKFLTAYPNENNAVALICYDLNFTITSGSNKFDKKAIQSELSRLYKEKGSIIEESIKKPLRIEEIERLIKDPYLLMIRKSIGLTNTLTEAEVFGLISKQIDKSITVSSDLLSAAAFSYIESDGIASIFYLKKALANDNFSETIKIFIEKSIERLENPDIYEGSIGLIILEIDNTSILKQKGLNVGDIVYKMNGELLIEPLDISSMLAKTKKEEDILFEVYKPEDQIKRIAISGSSTIGCKLSQLVTLNAFQL